MPRASKVELRNIMKDANKMEKGGYSKSKAMKEAWRTHKMRKTR